MKYAASSISLRQLAARRRRASTGVSQPTVSDSSALRRPALGERHRVQPAREVAQLGLSLAELVAGEAQDVGGLVAAVELALGDLEQVRDGQQPLLRAVVQVAADAPALGVGGLDHARARAPQRGRLMAALELGRRPRREDAHRGDVIVPGRASVRASITAMWPRCVPSAARRQIAR